MAIDPSYIKNSEIKAEIQKKSDAKKSLNNYIEQLQFHFNLSEDELISVLKNVLKARENINSIKKWWQIWK